jgi:cytochrome c peroxidase
MRRALLVLLAACPKSNDKPVDPTPAKLDGGHDLIPADDAATAIVLPDPPALPAVPAGLPPPPDLGLKPEELVLGELLFFDGRLASDGKTSCASCHDPAHGYAGGIDKASDGKPNLRRTPALANLAWKTELGWDGRYASIDEQLVAHVHGQQGVELGAAMDKLVAAKATYRAHVARVTAVASSANAERAAAPEAVRRSIEPHLGPLGTKAIASRALAAYVLTRYEGDSPWDRVEQSATKSSKDPVMSGYALFAGKAQCGTCHTPPLYTDLGYHRVARAVYADDGRGKLDPNKPGAFATPTLRGAARRTLFFHGGTAKSLDEVVASYESNPELAIKLTPGERDDLLAFLRALTSSAPTPARPVLP